MVRIIFHGQKIVAHLSNDEAKTLIHEARDELRHIHESRAAEDEPIDIAREVHERRRQLEQDLGITHTCRIPNTIYQLRTALAKTRPSHTYSQKLCCRVRNHVWLQPTRNSCYSAQRGTNFEALLEDLQAQVKAYGKVRMHAARKVVNSLCYRSAKAVKRQAKKTIKKKARQSKRDRKSRKRKGRSVRGAGRRERSSGGEDLKSVDVHFKNWVASSDVERPWKWVLWVRRTG